MPNEAGPWPLSTSMREGKPVSAEQLRRITDALTRRISGDGKTIRVRTFAGGQIIIEAIGRENANGGGDGVRRVKTLPPIPTNGSDVVYWIDPTESDGAGATGDGQRWETSSANTRWYPMWKATDKSGVPV